MSTIAELDERIGELRIEMAAAEDRGNADRAAAIRSAIRDLQVERDMLPRQRGT